MKKITYLVIAILLFTIVFAVENPVRIFAKKKQDARFNEDPCEGKSGAIRLACITAWCDRLNLGPLEKLQCIGQLKYGDYQCIDSEGHIEYVNSFC